MRISDWSSDVCSSDLRNPISRTKRSGRRFQNRLELRGKFILARAEGAVEGGRADGEGVDARLGKGADAREAVDATGDHESAPGGTARRPHQLQRVGLGGTVGQQVDRKSVEQGKSASVRVALGGRRINTKTNSKIQNTN